MNVQCTLVFDKKNNKVFFFTFISFSIIQNSKYYVYNLVYEKYFLNSFIKLSLDKAFV